MPHLPSPQSAPPEPTRPALGDKLALAVVVLFGCVVLAIGAFERMPYGYYTFLRVSVCFAAFVLVAAIESGDWSLLRIVLVGLIVLYNPFVPFHLSRSTWFPINIATMLLLVVAMYPASRPRTKSK